MPPQWQLLEIVKYQSSKHPGATNMRGGKKHAIKGDVDQSTKDKPGTACDIECDNWCGSTRGGHEHGPRFGGIGRRFEKFDWNTWWTFQTEYIHGENGFVERIKKTGEIDRHFLEWLCEKDEAATIGSSTSVSGNQWRTLVDILVESGITLHLHVQSGSTEKERTSPNNRAEKENLLEFPEDEAEDELEKGSDSKSEVFFVSTGKGMKEKKPIIDTGAWKPFKSEKQLQKWVQFLPAEWKKMVLKGEQMNNRASFKFGTS